LSNEIYTIIEWIAAAAGLINVYLLTRQSIWSWPAGLLSVLLYAFVFFHNHLYSDVVLHAIYVLLNIYGWYTWSRKSDTDSLKLSVSLLTASQIVLLSIIILPGFLIWGYLVGKNTSAVYVYPDAFVLVTSLCAQYLLAVKKLENWILWILVDIVAIIIYFLKGLYVTSGLYAIYLLICIAGYIEWNKSLHSVQSGKPMP
jgi:nicotinamide mononucleotide transporter